MFSFIYNRLSKLPSVYIEGCIYVCLAVLQFWQTWFGSDEAAKWISAVWLFWIKFVVGSLAATVLAIKLYRSTSFAQHKQQKQYETTISNSPTPVP